MSSAGLCARGRRHLDSGLLVIGQVGKVIPMGRWVPCPPPPARTGPSTRQGGAGPEEGGPRQDHRQRLLLHRGVARQQPLHAPPPVGLLRVLREGQGADRVTHRSRDNAVICSLRVGCPMAYAREVFTARRVSCAPGSWPISQEVGMSGKLSGSPVLMKMSL